MPAVTTTETIKSPVPLRPFPRPARPIGPHTIADWVAFERTTQTKHELHNGEYVEMSGGTFEHSAITVDTTVALVLQLEATGSQCEVVGNDMKIYVAPRKGYYPDITIVCGGPLIDFAEVLRNPYVLVEVLSESTGGFDRGGKFEDYRTIDSLRHYILVEQNRLAVAHYERTNSGSWNFREYTSLTDSLTLALSDATIAVPLSRIYRRVSFPDPAPPTEEESSQVTA